MERNVDLLKSQFDIDREPFSDSGVIGLFYPGAGRQELLDQLLHLVRYGPPMLLLHGKAGVGKTLLSKQLVRQLDLSIFTAIVVEASVLMDERTLMASISEGFSLKIELLVDSFVAALARYAAEAESYSQTSLVVIDNVQNLSAAAIDVLVQAVQSAQDKGLRFLLLVDDDDRQQGSVIAPLLLLIEPLGQEFEMANLREVEVEQYIAYRMRTAGLDAVRFSPQQIKGIVRDSLGNIARINQVARETLVRQVPVEPKKDVNQKFSFWHGSAIVIISLVIAALSYRSDVILPPEDDALEAMVGEKPVSGPPKHVDFVETRVSSPDIGLNKPSIYDQSLVDAEVDVDLNYVDPEVVWVKEERGEVESAVHDKVEDEFVFDDKLKSAEKQANTTVKVSTQQKVQKIEKSPAVSASKIYTAREQWLLSLDSKRFTMQMLGARDERAVQSFISKYPSLERVAYYKTLYKGKDWYVVVHGEFLTRNEARAAVAILPKALINSKPWIRPLAQIQKDIRKLHL